MTKEYAAYTGRKKLIIILLFISTIALGLYAIAFGSANLSIAQVISALLGQGNSSSQAVICNIRLPRILAGLLAGAGLSVSGCVMQNNLRNPLASPITMGISQAAAFGATLAIIALGVGKIQNSTTDAVIINNPYLVTSSAFIMSVVATLCLLVIFRRVSPEAMVLAGVALGSLFTAGTTIIQYFAPDVQVAAIVFWSFGDLGRAAWREVAIMAGVVGLALAYFMLRRWDYNALDSGEESAKGLGVNVQRVRLEGMFVSSLTTAVLVAFLGIIGFIGLVGPHMVRRVIGGDHRFLIPASALTGALLLLFSDTLARTVIAPVVLPVGAITSFMGAPLLLYLITRGYQRR
ncbi:MAG: iron ABC transporter permease [Syntrophomonas sp.]